MMYRSIQRQPGTLRRGAAAGLTVMCLPLIIGVAALCIDMGHMYEARTELQCAADAAALAAASAYLTESGLSEDHESIMRLGRQRAEEICERNDTLNEATYLEPADIGFGYHDLNNWKCNLSSVGRWNAVQVTARRTRGAKNSPVRHYFAAFFGKAEGEVIATARAAADDRFSSYRTELEETPVLIPFTINKDKYESMLSTGPDEYGYDEGIVESGDGRREIKLFPWFIRNESGTDGSAGSGNFGTLNVGLDNVGTSGLEQQIRTGIQPSELLAEFGTSELTFYDPAGNETTYTASGNPGLSGGMGNEVLSRRGQLVGFFLHKSVALQGSNARFTICGVRFGRIMEVDLHGSVKTRMLVIQPETYTGQGVVINENAPSSGGLVVRVHLVQ